MDSNNATRALLCKCFDHLNQEIARLSLNASAASGKQALSREIAEHLDALAAQQSVRAELAQANGLLNEVMREQPIDIAMRRHIFNHLEKKPVAAQQSVPPKCKECGGTGRIDPCIEDRPEITETCESCNGSGVQSVPPEARAVEEPRSAQILAGLPEHTNEQAYFEGRRGFWVQTDCVLIECDTPEAAIMEFRRKMAESGHIAVCHNFGTSGIRLLQSPRTCFPQSEGEEWAGLLCDAILDQVDKDSEIAAGGARQYHFDKQAVKAIILKHAPSRPTAAREDTDAANALERLHRIIDSAGVDKLMRGVELGQISWYHKANDAMKHAEAVLAARSANNRKEERP